MSDVKAIKGLAPWEVMRRASEGEPWAYYYGTLENRWIDAQEFDFERMCDMVVHGRKIAIIDTATPEIEWDKFDWDFFNQYGGLLIDCGLLFACDNPEKAKDNNAELRESPLYYWPGGEQPLPDNIEVEVCKSVAISINGAPSLHKNIDIGKAGSFHWDDGVDIFKLTGKVL